MSLVLADIAIALHASLARRLPEPLYQQWFAGAEVMTCDTDGLELGVKNRFFKNWIEAKYLTVLRDAASEAVGADISVRVSVSAALYAPFREAQEEAKKEAAGLDVAAVPLLPPMPAEETRPVAGRQVELNPGHTFQNLVVGSANRLAHAVALRAVAEPTEYGRLYFCGEHGVGKTHLLHAICHEILRVRPGSRIIQTTGERFVSDFVAAHAKSHLDSFRDLYRHCDVLVIDQIHVLGQGTKTASQAELLAIIDHLEARNRQTVFAGVQAPNELAGVEPRLRDRLGSGFVDRLLLPDEAMRRDLLSRKLNERGLALPDDALTILASELHRGVRRLEGTVNRLAALIGVGGMEPTVTCIRMALEVSTPSAKKTALVADDIIKAVSNEFGLAPDVVLGRGRSAPVRRARQVAAVLCRRLLSLRYVELGTLFDNRNHATMLSMIKKVPPELFSNSLEGRPVERVLFRLGVTMKPEEVLERHRKLF
ncbi:MAG: AAA family ATPase [Planctomycetes bacterium]|nr:AAA family ATPase [Planctomycetota bacterium]